MNLTVNGEQRSVPEGQTVAGLLADLGLTGKYVAVERNKQIVSFRYYAETVLAENDRLEIVSFVGGG